MIITTTYNLPDEEYLYKQAFNAHYAWAAIHDSLSTIRSYLKHGIGTPDDILLNVQEFLSEARYRIEE